MYVQKRKMSIWFNDFVYDDNDIIFASGSFNGVFRADTRSGESSWIGAFPEEDFFSCHLCSGMHKYGKYILFIPAWSKNFIVYDIEQKEFRRILAEMNLFCKKKTKYSFAYYASILQGKYVYVFGYDQPEIVRINMENLEAIRYEGWMDRLCLLGKKEEAPFFYKDICVSGNSLFLVTGQNNSIVELNMETNQIDFYPVGKSGKIYNTIAYDGEHFWLTEQAQGILQVDPKDWKGQYREINQKLHTDYFLCSIVIKGKVWLFANRQEDIYQIDCLNGKFNKLEVNLGRSDEWYPSKEGYGFRFVKMISEKKMVVFCAQDCQLHIFEAGKETNRIKFFLKDTETMMKLYKENGFWFWKDAKNVKEQDIIFGHIEDMIYFSKNFQGENQKNLVNYGEIIYKSVKDQSE